MANGIFSKFERDELNKITAKSILEKLMSIRQSINVEFTARRLVWELMQNAKDNAALCNEDGEKVDIKIQMSGDEFIFSHTKGYFTNEHIRGLIRKYSSGDKERDPEFSGKIYKTTGRFGTGFMTTHLLSESVEVESFYKNENDAYSFNKFSFWLDRGGKGEKDIINGINNAFDQAEESIKKAQSIAMGKESFQTAFKYPLSVEKIELAEIACEEAEKGIAYTLINVPEISSLNIDLDLSSDTYTINKGKTFEFEGRPFSSYNLVINGKPSTKNFIAVQDEGLQIIIPVSLKNGVISVLELDSGVPRIHLDFPLIGTEDLHLPFVINSSLFEPTEPRDGISLMGEENPVSKINGDIMVRAANLYMLFLSYVESKGDWKDLYNLANIRSPKNHSWINSEWYSANVLHPIRNKLLYASLVDVVDGGRISILDDFGDKQAFFPSAVSEIVMDKLWELASQLYPSSVPVKSDVRHWNKVLWKDCRKFTIEALSEEIAEKNTLETLGTAIGLTGKEALLFLNKYYELLNLEKIYIKEILSDTLAVLPNQLGELKLKKELFLDKGIEEELKNVCSILSTDPREYLIHKNAYPGDQMLFFPKKQDDIISVINNAIIDGKNEELGTACDYLASIFPEESYSEAKRRESIFNFSKKVYPDEFIHKRKIKHYDEKIWQESDKKSLFYVTSLVAHYETVETAAEQLNFESSQKFLTWLNSFVSFVVQQGFEGNINRSKHPILPNQNGQFCIKDSLFLDEGNIGDDLKDIAAELGHDFRDELLEEAIYLELPETRVYNIGHVADKISSFIKPIIRDVDHRKTYKTTLKKFYLWMDANRSDAETYFNDLYEKRFLFLEDDDISSNMKNASKLNELLADYGLETIDDLRSRLENMGDYQGDEDFNSTGGKTEITKEDLVSLGISTIEQLEEALKDPLISSRFYHVPKRTKEMLDYAQGLIERAKENIKDYLMDHPDYNCDDMEETAPTTLAGILKNGIPIQIVTRPSDNGEVIIYYASEKDTLDTENAELWVDNNKSNPHILTLGRILKSTGINRIPLNMN
jgi:hypothetical protein